MKLSSRISLGLCFLFLGLSASNKIVVPLFKTTQFERMGKFQPADFREAEKMSQSFMFTRPAYRTLPAQQSLWHDAVFCKEGILGGAFQAIGYYQQNISSDKNKRYFFFNDKNTLLVQGDELTMNATSTLATVLRDIRAEWLGLPADFSGTFTIDPRQQQAAVWFEYNQDLKNIFGGSDYFKPFWISIAAPVQMIENNINLQQGNIQNPGSPPFQQDIVSALNQPAWCFGKFNPESERLTAVAEIYFKLGIRFMQRDGFQIGMNNMWIFPLHFGQRAEFIFDPFIGHNRHFGYGNAITFQLPFNCNTDEYLVAFVFNIENFIPFANKQKRSLDLVRKPWSRYLLLNRNDGTKDIPGINVLTQEVSCKPFNMVDLQTGFRYQTHSFEIGIGYSLWAHGDERINLEENLEDQYGIAGDGTLIPGTTIAATASQSTICQQAPIDRDENGDPTFIPIKLDDIDTISAGARAAVAHRPYIAFGGFVGDPKKIIAFFGAGAYVEVPQQNTALVNWGVWGKFGADF